MHRQASSSVRVNNLLCLQNLNDVPDTFLAVCPILSKRKISSVLSVLKASNQLTMDETAEVDFDALLEVDSFSHSCR